MSQNLNVHQSLIEWCDQQVAEGKELSMNWEGGNDSGWCWFEIDGEKVGETTEIPQVDDLIDLMYGELDYGSWAGEFSSQGRAVYDSEEKAFVGIDYYSEDETLDYPCNLKVSVPKKFWFDRLEINVEDEEANVSAFFHVRNGFITPKHEDWITEFERDFSDQVEEVINKFLKDPKVKKEYRNVFQNWDLDKSEFSIEEDNMVCELFTLNIGIYETDEKHIYLQLKNENDEE